MPSFPNLTQHIPIVDKHGRPTNEFRIFWDTFKTGISDNLKELIQTEDDIIPNSRLSEDAVGWTFDAGVIRVENSVAGEPAVSIKATSGATGSNINKYAYANKHQPIYINSDQQYVVEYSLRGSNTLIYSTVGLTIEQYDVDGVLTATTDVGDNPTTSWATSSHAFTSETDAAYFKIKVNFYFENDPDQTATDTLEIADIRMYTVNIPATVSAGARYKFTGAITATCDAAGTTLTLDVTAGTLYAGKGMSYNAMSASRAVASGVSYTIYLYVDVNVFKGGDHTLEHTTFDYIPYLTPNNFYVGQVTITTGPSATASGVLGGGNNLNYP